MHNITNFLADWWLVAAIVLLACYGLGALAADTSNGFRKWLLGDRPKPRQYRVTVEDHDGWPIRTYILPSEAIGRLLREIERDKPA